MKQKLRLSICRPPQCHHRSAHVLISQITCQYQSSDWLLGARLFFIHWLPPRRLRWPTWT